MARIVLASMALLAGLVFGMPGQAVQPDEMLDDPALEARAREISAELRCLVCQNQSIDDSDADVARDLRLLVRKRLVAGDTDGQVIDHIHARFGDFVLLRPPLRPGTWLLWFGPFLLIAVAGFFVYRYLHRPAATRSAPEPAPLSADEQAELRRVLDDREGAPPPPDQRTG